VAEAPARYCSNCEHELNPEDRFCPNCERPVHRTATVPTPEADVPVPPPKQPGDAAAPPQQVEGSQHPWPGRHPLTHDNRRERGGFDITTSSEVGTYDVSEVTTLRKRLGRAALTTKLMGLLTALFIANEALVIAALSNTSPSVFAFMIPGVLILGVLIFWCAVRLSRGIRAGRKYAVVVTTIWLVCFACYVPLMLFNSWTSFSGVGRQIAFVEALLTLLIVYFTAKGLLAVGAYKRDLRSDPREGEPLRSNPWELAAKMGKHPAFVNKRSLGLYLLLMVVPVILVFAGVTLGRALIDIASTEVRDPVGNLWQLTGTTLFLVPWFLAILALYRRARREALLPASELSRRNPRPIILYLRSFLDDNLKMGARAANGRTWLDRLSSVRFEEVVTDHLWRYGPVVAIGKPGGVDDLPPLGAAREYFSYQTWRQAVEQLMVQASTIVLAVGRTEGLLWELNALIRLALTRKLILLLPPVQTSDLRPRWDYLQQHATEAGVVLPEDVDLEHARVIVFPPGRTAYVITADERDDWAHEAALDAAEELIRQWRGTSSGSSTERSAAIAVGNALGSPQEDMNEGSTALGSRSSDYDLSSPLKSFAKVVWRIVVSPAEFFSSIRRRGDFLPPLIFALIWIEISAVGREIFTGDLSTVLSYLIVDPIYLILRLLFAAVITHLLVMLFLGSAKSGVEATFRIFCFASPPYTLTWMFDWFLPILVPGVLLLYGLFLTFLGFREMHRTTTVRAALASLISFGVFLFMGVFV